MNESKTPSGAAIPCIDLLGLSVTHKEDGCWMRFRASTGREACVNLTAFATERCGIIGSTIRQWIEDVRPNTEAVGRGPAAGTRTHEPRLGNLEEQMKVEAMVKSKSQRIGEDEEDFLARKPDRVVTVELDDVVTNPDDIKGESVVYVGIRRNT